ncbi:hypothetical protein GCM10009725_30350 [Aeromicrobium tamlense]
MTTVRNASDRSYISSSVGRVDPGSTVDVDDETASYLVEQTGYFEYAESTDVEFTEVDDSEDDLDELLKEDLLEIAREEDIDGRSDMTKAELITAIEAAQEG